MGESGQYLLGATEYGSPSEGVLKAVGGVTGRDADDLPILYDAVDPDELDTVVEDGAEAVEFEYAGFAVTVDADAVQLRGSPAGDRAPSK